MNKSLLKKNTIKKHHEGLPLLKGIHHHREHEADMGNRNGKSSQAMGITEEEKSGIEKES